MDYRKLLNTGVGLTCFALLLTHYTGLLGLVGLDLHGEGLAFAYGGLGLAVPNLRALGAKG